MKNNDEATILFMAKQCVESLKKDGMADIFINSPESFQNELASAYMVSEVKKFQSFVGKYLTNKEFSDNFKLLVASI